MWCEHGCKPETKKFENEELKYRTVGCAHLAILNIELKETNERPTNS